MRRVRTYRDLKNKSLDVARKQLIPSFTAEIEKEIKTEIEKDLGPVLSEEERSDILKQEKERKEKQDMAIRKSRVKILTVKEKAKETQRIRDALNEQEITATKSDNNFRNKKTGKVKSEISEQEFNTISIRY